MLVDRFTELVAALDTAHVRFVLIGVAGANYYAASGATLFLTRDRDLFLPPDPENLLRAWRSTSRFGLRLFCAEEPFVDLDLGTATRVAERRALVTAIGTGGLEVDLTLVMGGFDFEEVWRERRIFRVGDVEIPVALLSHIVASKKTAGRDKDRLFLATHAEALRALLAREAKK